MNQLLFDTSFYNTTRTKKRTFTQDSRHTGGIGDIDMLNSYSAPIAKDNSGYVLRTYGFNNQLIEINEKFKKELYTSVNINKPLAIKAYRESINLILGLNPDKISLEITESDSIYYTVLRKDFSIYIEEYIDDNEVNVVSFKKGVKQVSFSGTIQEVIFKINSMIFFDF